MRRFMDVKLSFEQASQAIQVLIATLLITLGYIVTPILFSHLPQQVAGEIGGILFEISAQISLALLILLSVWGIWLKLTIKSLWHYAAAASVLILLYWVITPMMREIKQSYPGGINADSPDWTTFASLHGVYQLFYMLLIVLMLFGVVKSFIAMHRKNVFSNKKSL